jgi:hypothetical protein
VAENPISARYGAAASRCRGAPHGRTSRRLSAKCHTGAAAVRDATDWAAA